MDNTEWKIGDRMQVNACEGELVLNGTLQKIGMFVFFVSDDRGPLKKEWRFRVSIPLRKVLWFDGSVDLSVIIKRIE